MQGPHDTFIQGIIRSGNDYCYDTMIRDQREREPFYQLSSLRRGVLCWYPFQRGWKCLEIGSGFGSLTGVLLQNMKTVDAVEPDELRRSALAERYRGKRLTVYPYLPEGEKYDCIVLTEAFTKETNEKTLSAAYKLLTDGGVMLLGYENRFGMKYETGWSDASEPRQPAREMLYSRDEVSALMQKTGFQEQFTYYILPDALFPQAVFSQESLPGEETDRFFFYRGFSSTRQCAKEAAFRSALRAGEFEQRADYCLVELRKKPYAGRRVVMSYLSCDRGREHSFFVRFFNNGIVEKLPVYPEGQRALTEMFRNLESLKSRGLRTVAQELDGACIRMPFVDQPSVLWYLKEHPEEIETVLDLPYQDILASSDLLGEDKVLKCGYIDMIPFNCFYDRGKLVYYDQEFTETNCPASYIMFRAVYYTYLHIPKLNDWVLQETLKEKYGLQDKWAEYKAREERFVRENRNQDLYYRFWE